jgi:hypothetical protein
VTARSLMSPRMAGEQKPTKQRNVAVMIRIAISQAGFEAIAATLPLGSAGYENEINKSGERLIRLDHAVVARLGAIRGPGESYRRGHFAAGGGGRRLRG